MTIITAETILSSQHAQRTDKRLTTMLLTYPRPIHAEFMTHRQFSRNASSSRAIPISKMIQDVMDNPFVPLHWGKNQKGMQASEECSKEVHNWDEYETPVPKKEQFLHREEAWLCACAQAIRAAEAFAEAGYHKQIVNRLLEPFMHIRVVVSATEWSNFLALRDHPDAEPHIAMLARAIRQELDKPVMQVLEPGQWHLPFVQGGDEYADGHMSHDEFWIKKSVACCASTSYKTVEGFAMTLEKGEELHDKLVGSSPLHASPAEHVAQADDWLYNVNIDEHKWLYPEQHGNFVGFRQYRKQLPNECL